MSLVIPRPLPYRGQYSVGDSSDWLTGSSNTVVDALMLAQNFAEIYEKVNGGLHGSNLAYPGDYSGITNDNRIRFPEFFVGEGILTYVSHSHDGIDSALLGEGAVDIYATEYRSFGAIMSPSKRVSQVILFGQAAFPKYSGAEVYCECPYKPPWSTGVNPTFTSPRAFASIYYPATDLVLTSYKGPQCSLVFSHPTGGAPIEPLVKVFCNVSVGASTAFALNWLATFIAHID